MYTAHTAAAACATVDGKNRNEYTLIKTTFKHGRKSRVSRTKYSAHERRVALNLKPNAEYPFHKKISCQLAALLMLLGSLIIPARYTAAIANIDKQAANMQQQYDTSTRRQK